MTDIHVRPMRAEEKRDVGAVMRRSFSPTQQLFFSWTPDVLVAEQDGKSVGAVVLKVFPLPGGRKGGLIAWIFTAPETRGAGAGQQLVESALEFFEEQGCDEVMACVEGYNTSSSKLFATRGFSILSPGQQFRRYGLGTLAVWVHAFHLIDVGHFLWVRPAATQPDNPTMQWLGNWLANVLIYLLVFCGQYPIPGSFYPSSDRWRYRDLVPELGPMALAGVLPVLALTWGAWALSRFGALGAEASRWISSAMAIGYPLLIFDRKHPAQAAPVYWLRSVTYIGRLKGYQVVICMSELMSDEHKQLLRALGADLVLTPAELGIRGSREKAQELASIRPNAIYME